MNHASSLDAYYSDSTSNDLLSYDYDKDFIIKGPLQGRA